MPLFMDRHDLNPGETLTPQDVAAAHMRDVQVQEKYGVRYITYWFDYVKAVGFCLVDAPSPEAAESVHREAHGLIANRIIPVDMKTVEDFLGRIEEADPREARNEIALRTILFTDMEGSTSLASSLGDDRAMEILHEHDEILGECLGSFEGRRIKHTGDGMMACFASVVRALECACRMQMLLSERNEIAKAPIRIRIGLNAGEPVAENDDLYGTAVILAARICGTCEPGRILAASVVKDLAMGKTFSWEDRGHTSLRGFNEPVHLHELRWG